MRISVLGGDQGSLVQIPRLREAFAQLGHEHTFAAGHDDTAFVFVGNAPYDNYLQFCDHKKVIFNVLDTCVHCTNHADIIERLRHHLPQAARVTTISKTVARELADKVGVNAEVIYYPAKNVAYTGVIKYPQFKVAMVGRVGDANKRAASAVKALIKAGYNESEVAIIGPEYLGWGTRMGVVTDEALNDIYNSVDYVMMLSRNEGIGLPAIESALCGAIPIVAPDLSTFTEFWVDSPLGLHYQTLTDVDKISRLMIDINTNPSWKATIKQDMLGYASLAFKPKFDKLAVARRILDVYGSI